MNFVQIKQLKDKILDGYLISRDEALLLSNALNIQALYYSANQIRAKFRGRCFDMCAVVNTDVLSCGCNCINCKHLNVEDINANNKSLNINDVLSVANNFVSKNVKRILLGFAYNKLSDNNFNYILSIYNTVSKSVNTNFCASLGPLTEAQLLKLRHQTNIKRYQCNLYTSKRIFEKYFDYTYQDVIDTIAAAKKLDFEICSALIIGIGESFEERIDTALLLRDLGVKSVVLHFIGNLDDLPKNDSIKLGNQEILTTIAVLRFVLPKADIRLGVGRNFIKIIEKETLRLGINSVQYQLDTYNDIETDKQIFNIEGFIV